MYAAESPPRGRLAGVAGLLAALAFVLYLPSGGFAFLNFDDPDYVTRNPGVLGGLSQANVRWAFGFHAANWHPLTWLSHQLDVELFGLDSSAMHRVNAGLHALGAALLFLALVELTRRRGASLLVAALFAVHPLRVQCVAWVAERKELLASVFFFGLLLAYGRYARSRGRGAYLTALACLALGCMAKPMLVTAPFVLLLLDSWPLGRGRGPTNPRGEPVRRLLLEKLPFLALAAASAVLTWRAQQAGGAVGELAALPLLERLGTAGGGLLFYLRASAWPAGLAAFYPHPVLLGHGVLVSGLLGAVVLGLGCALAWRARRGAPAFLVGWLWFLGMLVPVIGLVQVGDQGWADRYAYLPTIGLYLALAFPLQDLLATRARLRTPVLCAAWLAVAALALVTLRTLPHWRDSHSLFERALAVTEGNWIAHNNLGLALLEAGQTEPARAHFEAALRAHPRFPNARYNLGLAQELAGDPDAAEQSYRTFLAAQPQSTAALQRLAALARARGDAPAALEWLEALRALQGDSPQTLRNLGAAHERLGHWQKALAFYQRALEGDPRLAEAARAAAWILATGPPEDLLDGPRALTLARTAAALGAERTLEVLAAAHARLGDFAAALEAQERALAEPGLTPAQQEALSERLELYRAGRPYTRRR